MSLLFYNSSPFNFQLCYNGLRTYRGQKMVSGRVSRPIEVRFLEKVTIGTENECWIWEGHTKDGYPRINSGKEGGYGDIDAAKVSYKIFIKKDPPPDLYLFRVCLTKTCVNPNHLEFVTKEESGRRGFLQTGKDVGRIGRIESNPIERFWSKVDKSPGLGPSGDCWEWVAQRDPSGYGIFRYRNINYRSTRFLIEFIKGTPIKEDLYVCHACDNPPCVNPDHLWLGTPKENMQDMINKGRKSVQRGEDHIGAKYTEDFVRQVREYFKQNPEINRRILAEKFNVSHGWVIAVIHNKIWKHIK